MDDNEQGDSPNQSWLPDGVTTFSLTKNIDERGSLVEIYRDEWLETGSSPIQWNHVRSEPNVLRGIHVHHTHHDYLYMADGLMQLVLVEARRNSDSFGMWIQPVDATR